LLVKEDYIDPCTYGEDGDEELNLDIDGDNDEKINHHFKDVDINSWIMWWPLDVNAIFILKFGQLMHSMHGRNYKKLDTSLSIVELYAFEPKLLVNYLSKKLLQVVKKNREFYPPTKLCSYSFIYFIFWLKILNKVLNKIDDVIFCHCLQHN
jgi:hypothetical protein